TAPPTSTPAPAETYYCSSGHVGCSQLPECETGYACAYVSDSNTGRDYHFHYIQDRTYSLNNWRGTGALANHQTGNAAVRLSDGAGRQFACYPPNSPDVYLGVNWERAFKLQLTEAAC